LGPQSRRGERERRQGGTKEQSGRGNDAWRELHKGNKEGSENVLPKTITAKMAAIILKVIMKIST